MYFWTILLSQPLLWTYSELLSCLGLLRMVAALVVTNCSVHHPVACCPLRRASDTDWHHPGQTESWVQFLTSWFIHCSLGQWYRLWSLKFAPCGAFWRQIYRFYAPLAWQPRSLGYMLSQASWCESPASLVLCLLFPKSQCLLLRQILIQSLLTDQIWCCPDSFLSAISWYRNAGKFGKEGLEGLQVVGGDSLQKIKGLVMAREDKGSRYAVMLKETMAGWVAFVQGADSIDPNQGILGYS